MTNKEVIDILNDWKTIGSDITIEAFSKAIEALEKENVNDWIHRPVPFPEWNSKFEEVEKALGFPLFVWQKTYIINGKFRQYGETTAKILRELLDIQGAPIDYTKPPCNRMDDFYRYELREIWEQLDKAGIKMRPVFFSDWDKKKYYQEERTLWSDSIMSKYR